MIIILIIAYAIWSVLSLTFSLALAFLKTAGKLVGSTAPKLGSASTTLVLLGGAYFLNTALITKQDLVMNIVGEAYECHVYPLVYGFTNSDFAGPAIGILLRDTYDFIEPKWNGVVDYLIVGVENAANQIIGILPLNFAGSFTDTWTALDAVWDFIIHVFRTPHSTSVPEISIPHLTVTILDFIIDWITCWLQFFFTFVRSMAELLFLGTCGPACVSLSENACNCTKLTFGVISFFPANGYVTLLPSSRRGKEIAQNQKVGLDFFFFFFRIRSSSRRGVNKGGGGAYVGLARSSLTLRSGIYQEFVDDFVDILCCGLDFAIEAAKSLASGNFFAASPTAPFLNCDQLLIEADQCVRLALRWITGDSYTGGFFRPITDGFMDVVLCWVTLIKDIAEAIIISILFTFPSYDSQLDGLVTQFSACICTTLRFITGSVFTGDFTTTLDALCPVIDCWLNLGLRLFRSFRDLTFLSDSLGLFVDWCACARLTILWFWNSTGPGVFFVPFVEVIVDLGCELGTLLFKLVHDSLVPGTLPLDIVDRVADLVSLMTNFLDVITGGSFFGTSVIDPIPTTAGAVAGNFLSVFFQLAISITTGSFFTDLPLLITQFFASVLSLMNLVTDNRWAAQAMPAFTTFAQCGTIGFTELLDLKIPTGPLFVDKLNTYLIRICLCTDNFIEMAFPAGLTLYGVPVRNFLTCLCNNLRTFIRFTENRDILRLDCHFCSHPNVAFGQCGSCVDLVGDYCRCWSGLLGDSFALAPGSLGGIGALVDDIGDAVCCFPGTIKPILGALLSTANGDAVEAASQFAQFVTDMLGCLDEVLTLASGGVVTNFLQFLANLIIGFIPGIGDLLLIVNCLMEPVANFWQRPISYGGTLAGAVNQPTIPVIPDPVTGAALGNCQAATTIVQPIITCLNDPAIGILAPFRGVANVMLATDPNQSPIMLLVNKFDMLMECPCEFWTAVSSGGLTCDDSCFTCAGGLTIASTEWSDLKALFDALPDPPFGGVSPDLTAVTSLQFNPTIICCLPSLFTCMATQSSLGVGGPINGMFVKTGQILNEIFSLAITLMCSLIHFMAFFNSIFNSLASKLDTLGALVILITNQITQLFALVNLLQTDITNLTSTIASILIDIANLQASVSFILGQISAIITTLSQFNGFFDTIEELCHDIPLVPCDLFRRRSSIPLDGLLELKEACPFHEFSDVWPSTAGGLLEEGEGGLTMKQLDLCMCSVANIMIDSTLMQPVPSKPDDQHMWNASVASANVQTCLGDLGSMAGSTPIDLRLTVECAWKMGLEGMLVFDDYPMSRCLLLLHHLSPILMQNATRMKQVGLESIREYETCYLLTLLEETSRQKALLPNATLVHESMKLPDSTDPTNIFIYLLTPILKTLANFTSATASIQPPDAPPTAACVRLDLPDCPIKEDCLLSSCTTCHGSVPLYCNVNAQCVRPGCALICNPKDGCLVPSACQANISTCTGPGQRRRSEPVDPTRVFEDLRAAVPTNVLEGMTEIMDELRKHSNDSERILKELGSATKEAFRSMAEETPERLEAKERYARYQKWRGGLRSYYQTKRRRFEVWVDTQTNFSIALDKDPGLFERTFPHIRQRTTTLLEEGEEGETDEQRVTRLLQGIVRAHYKDQLQRTQEKKLQRKVHKQAQKSEVQRVMLAFAEERQANEQDMVAWLQKQKEAFAMAKERSRRRSPSHQERWEPAPTPHRARHVPPSASSVYTEDQLVRIYAYTNMSRAVDDNRVFWVQDTAGHYGYAHLEEDDPLLPMMRAAGNRTLEWGKVPESMLDRHHARFPHSAGTLRSAEAHAHRQRRVLPPSPSAPAFLPLSSSSSSNLLEVGGGGSGVKDEGMPGFIKHVVDGWNKYNMSHHTGVLGNVTSALYQGANWRSMATYWFRNLNMSRTNDTSVNSTRHGFFVFRVNKPAWSRGLKSLLGVGGRERPRAAPVRPKRREERAILPNDLNKSPFNANDWLVSFFDTFLEKTAGLASGSASTLVQTIEDIPLEETIETLIETAVDYAVCTRPQDYTVTFKITCIPNIPVGALGWLQPVPTENFPRQLWDRVPGITKPGSCVNAINRPTDNCAVLDGGNRPNCLLPAPLTCDWCVQTFFQCKEEIGFEDVGDALAFSLSALPRVYNVITNPKDNMGVMGDPTIAVPAAIIFPNYLTFALGLVTSGTFALTPILNMILPDAQKFTTAVFLSTVMFQYPVMTWNPLDALRPIVVAVQEVWDPFQIPTWAITKIDRHNHPNAAIEGPPARDTLCYFFTFANLVFPWVIFLLLVMIFAEPALTLAKDLLLWLASVVSAGIHIINLAISATISRSVGRIERTNLYNRADIIEQDKRLDLLEEEVKRLNPTLEAEAPPEESTSVDIRRRRT